MLLLMRMMMMMTMMITIIVWTTMVKLTTMAMVTIIKDIQEVCLIENWSPAKVTMRSCFLFENSALDQNFNIMFFSFFTMRWVRKKWFVLVWICAHIWLETNITPSSLLFRDAIVGIICHVLLLDAGPFYCRKVRSGCQLWLFQKLSSSPSYKPCHCRRRGGCQLWLSRKLSE